MCCQNYIFSIRKKVLSDLSVVTYSYTSGRLSEAGICIDMYILWNSEATFAVYRNVVLIWPCCERAHCQIIDHSMEKTLPSTNWIKAKPLCARLSIKRIEIKLASPVSCRHATNTEHKDPQKSEANYSLTFTGGVTLEWIFITTLFHFDSTRLQR